ncbi:MAG: hypothetical protein HZC36_14935 [Armatimonadetes bacterium]|nr:hypothetical protein [Armatimonadota bacterium]
MLNYLLGSYSSPSVVVHEKVPSIPAAETQQLMARLDAMELAFAGLWKLLKAQGFTNEHLTKAMEEVDQEDGNKDGRITPVHSVCPSCGQKILSRVSKKCLWCGADVPVGPLR